MKIKRRSVFSGKENTLEINVSEEQVQSWLHGNLIQKAMPNLTPDEREFIMTGILPDEWEKMTSGEN